jgi:dUTPase
MAKWKWLESTHELQTKTYRYDFGEIAVDPEQLSYYLLWNFFAANQELAEAAVEFSWKPWAIDDPFVNTERILNEIVDINHFLGNVLVVLGISDKQYEAAYRAKQDKNRRRAVSGNYSAKKGGLGEGSDNE